MAGTAAPATFSISHWTSLPPTPIISLTSASRLPGPPEGGPATNTSLSRFFDVFHDLAKSGFADVRSPFGGWIPEVYDMMEGDFEDDIPLVLDLARTTGGPVVDLGSGTGRLSIPLAREGLKVYAVDSSEAMQQRLAEKAAAEPPVSAAIHPLAEDITTFKLPEPAALAVCSTNTFLYLESLELQKKALQNISDNLQPGGMLWLDVYVPKPNPSAAEPFLTSHHDPDSGTLLLYATQSREDHFSGTTLVNAYTLVFGRQDRPEIYVQEWRYSWLHPNELRLLLQNTGFHLERLLGDYEGEDADDLSVQMIAVARKI